MQIKKGDKITLEEGLRRSDVTFISSARGMTMIKDVHGQIRYVNSRLIKIQTFCLHCAAPYLIGNNESNFCSPTCRSAHYD